MQTRPGSQSVAFAQVLRHDGACSTASVQTRSLYAPQVFANWPHTVGGALQMCVSRDRQSLWPLVESVARFIEINLDAEDFSWATAELMEIADDSAGGRVVSMLEGGYDLKGLAESAAAHIRQLMAS